MTVGIYKITNNINNKCYIGQSRNVEKRWENHKYRNLDYPLYRAFRKYGIQNFTFEIIEECSVDELNSKEAYWIEYYCPEYNQTVGGDFKIVPQKLTEKQVNEIKILLATGKYLHSDLAKRYGVHKDTIRDINVGRTWYDDTISYPIHLSKYCGLPIGQQISYCPICGKPKSKQGKICYTCYEKQNAKKAFYKRSKKQLRKIVKQVRKKIKEQHKQPFKRFKVNQYSKEGNFIASFDSIADAVRKLISDNECAPKSESGARSHIAEVCKGKRKTAYGYKWEHIE